MDKKHISGEEHLANRIIRTHRSSDMVIYRFDSDSYDYSAADSGCFIWNEDNSPLWDVMERAKICTAETADNFAKIINDMKNSDKPQSYSTEYQLTNADKNRRWYRVCFICIPNSTITITFTDIDEEVVSIISKRNSKSFDDLTNLYVYNTFCNKVQQIIYENQDEAIQGKYAIVYFNVQRFKAINDMYGMDKGNSLIMYIGSEIEQILKEGDIGSHISSDKFAFFTHRSGQVLTETITKLFKRIEMFNPEYKIICNAGVYITNTENLSAAAMVDRAILAHSVIKGGYNIRC
ncbi:MAG: diguanylate cyclase, partial [Spirochaetales bacterium]|nr:diguanylate cyclase [Spirochaetales bacterium]